MSSPLCAAACRLLVLFFMALGASTAVQALPSSCAAMWGLSSGQLVYWSAAGASWLPAARTTLASPNAIGGFEGDGTLYFADTTAPASAFLHRAVFSNSTGTITFSQVGGAAISVPSALTYTASTGAIATASTAVLVGATFDRDTANRRMFLYVTTGAGSVPNLPVDGTTTGSPLAAIGIVDAENPSAASWTVVHQGTSTGTVTYPLIGGSGDVFADQVTGSLWIATNSAPNRMLRLDVAYTGFTIHSARVVGTADIFLGAVPLAAAQAAVSVDPVDGRVFIASGVAADTWALADPSANPVAATLVSGSTGAADAGNCVAPPERPRLAKSFSPATVGSPGTSTLTIVLHNPNRVPIFTTRPMTDTFPAGLTVQPVPAVSAVCHSDGVALATRPASVTLTAVGGAGRVVVSQGAFVPGGAAGGSCSFSVGVSATTAGLYDNLLPPASLQTTAGSNEAAAFASLRIQAPGLPGLPVLSKRFDPETSSAATGTTTLTIVIGNPNNATDTLTSALLDVMPANLRITSPSLLSIACFSDGAAVATPGPTTATAAPGRLTVAAASLIPGGTAGGSCSFSVRTTATVAGLYANTLAAGSLTTAAGTNAQAATATFHLRASDFSIAKAQRLGATGPASQAVLDVPPGGTVSYVIGLRNETGLSGTRTFADTIPALVTPVLSVTALPAGAAGCLVATGLAAGQTVVSGTVSNAAPGEGCDFTVVARASVTAVVGTVTNSVGLAVPAGAFDAVASNNTATVVLIIKPPAQLTISKTDGATAVATGSSLNYTITVANLGPSGADRAVMRDPAATGLSCSSVTCSASGGAACPAPLQLYVSALQTTGVAIPRFPAGSSVSFVVTCAVTATGLP